VTAVAVAPINVENRMLLWRNAVAKTAEFPCLISCPSMPTTSTAMTWPTVYASMLLQSQVCKMFVHTLKWV